MSSQSQAFYEGPSRQLLAILRALRTIPGPDREAEARMLRAAAHRIGRTVIDANDGRVLLGWDADAEGAWAGDGMDSIRSTRPAQPRLLRTLAACLRCCWADPETPIYPAGPASIDDVLAATASLTAPYEVGEAKLGGARHTRGALTTLDSAGLIVLNLAEQTLTLGPVIATWPERDISVLRGAWSRLPQPPASRPAAVAGQPAEPS